MYTALHHLLTVAIIIKYSFIMLKIDFKSISIVKLYFQHFKSICVLKNALKVQMLQNFWNWIGSTEVPKRILNSSKHLKITEHKIRNSNASRMKKLHWVKHLCTKNSGSISKFKRNFNSDNLLIMFKRLAIFSFFHTVCSIYQVLFFCTALKAFPQLQPPNKDNGYNLKRT